MDIHEICEEERCHCEHGLLSSAASHTLKVFVYIFLISLALNIIIGLAGEETLAGFFTGTPIVGEMMAALVGLIPNCASSVVITQLYLDHIIGAGAMMAGLLVNAGVGLLDPVPFKSRQSSESENYRNSLRTGCILGNYY